MKFTTPTLVTALISLAACGGDPTISNPSFFSFRMNDATLNGNYNPAGYNAKQVKFYLAQECSDKKLASYSEGGRLKTGLVPFEATCRDDLIFTGHHSIQRLDKTVTLRDGRVLPAGTVLGQGTVSKGDGNVLFTQKTY